MRLVRLAVYAGAGIVFLMIALLLFTESAYFKKILRDFIVRTADASLNASLSIEELDGNLFAGWSLTGVSLTDASGPIISVDNIVLRYELRGLLMNRIVVRELTLNKPEVAITRAEGRDWNINELFPPSDDTDTTTTPFSWRVIVENLRVVGGRLLVYDSTKVEALRPDELDGDRLELHEVELALKVDIRPSKKHASINQFRWTNMLGDVHLRNVSGDIELRPTGANVWNLSVQTDRSALIVSAAIDDVDILEGFESEKLADYPMAVSLNASAVHAEDLRYFLPVLDFLGGQTAIRLQARGSLRELAVRSLHLQAYESELQFAGTLHDILEGAEMRIDVRSDASTISGHDVPRLLPGIPIMDVSGLGSTNFSVLRFTGTPLAFEAEVDVASEAGSAKAVASFDFANEDIAYDLIAQTSALDLSAVLLDANASSSISMNVTMNGVGTQIGRMRAALDVRADSSRYRRTWIDRIRTTVDVRPDSLTMVLDTRSGRSALSLDGGMSFEPDSITGFSLKAFARSMDLGMFLEDEKWDSDITFAMHAYGDGIDVSRTSGMVEINLEQSRLGEISLDNDTLRMLLKQSEHEQELFLFESRYADLRMEGKFDFSRLFAYMGEQADSLSAAFSRFDLYPDTTTLHSAGAMPAVQRHAPIEVRDSVDFMDATYSITLKHPEHIAKYFNVSTFIVRGSHEGRIRGGNSGFDIQGNLRISDFYFVDTIRTWLAAGLRFNYEIHNLTLERPLDNISVRAVASVVDMNINGLKLHRVEATLNSGEQSPRVRIRAGIDTLAEVDLDAVIAFSNHAFDVHFPLLAISWRGERFSNAEEVKLRIDSSGITLAKFGIVNNGMQLSVQGNRSFDGNNNFTMYLDSLDVRLLEYALTGHLPALQGEGFTGLCFVEANLTGTDALPLMAAAVYIDGLGYRGAQFGNMTLEARYFEEQLELYSELEYSSGARAGEKVFFLSGTVPTTISFSDEGEEDSPSTASANLRMQMRAFPLALLEEFLGIFSPLQGEINADVSISGTAEHPSYNGYMSVEAAMGRFLFNNMDYILGLRVEAIDQDIRIVNASIQNIQSDWPMGRITATGSISTDAFAISSFDLAMNGRLKILRNASRAATRSIYGDLFISTGKEDLTYRGRLDRSIFSGDLVIEEGNLIVPLEQQGGDVGSFADITYVVVDDTTRRFVSSLTGSRGRRGLPTFDTDQIDETPQVPERSVLDGLTYDLTVSTEKKLIVAIPFTIPQVELNATLAFNNLKVNNWGGMQGSFMGEVNLSEESYFIFFGKRLMASGVLRFTRDPQNPDLDLKGVYSDYYIDPRTDIRRRVYVTVTVTGTKEKPELAYDMTWDGPDGEQVSKGGEVQSDAFSFLLFGMFTKDFSGSDRNRSAFLERSPEWINAVGSAMLSSVATQFLDRAGLQGIIKRVDIAGLGTEDSRVKLTSEIGRAIFTYDGKINNLESSNITVDFPLSRLLGIPWTNLVVQVSRRTIDQIFESATRTQEYSIYELKILQRFSF